MHTLLHTGGTNTGTTRNEGTGLDRTFDESHSVLGRESLCLLLWHFPDLLQIALVANQDGGDLEGH